MTTHGRYAASDSSFAQSTGNAATKGLALIAVAVVIGFLLLWQGGVGGDSSVTTTPNDDTAADDGQSGGDDAGADDADADDNGSDSGGDDAADPGDDNADDTDTNDDDTGDDGGTDTGDVTPTTRPLGEVKVAVANGVGVSGLAGQQAQLLTTAGFTTVAVNAAANTELSAVYYVDGYALEAEAVAVELGATGAVLRAVTDVAALVADPTAVDGFHVIVVLGSDRVLG